MSYESFIAKRHLRSKKRVGFVSLTTYISIIGVTIGVAALIIVLSIMNGFESEVRSRFIGFKAHVTVGRYHNQGIEHSDSVIEQISDIEHIIAISRFIEEKALIRSSENTGEAIIMRGVDQETVTQVSDLGKNIYYGELNLGEVSGPEGEQPLPGIILGYYLWDKLRVSLGDKVTIGSLTGVSGLFGPTLNYKQYRVAGIFRTDLYEFDDNFAYVSVESAQELFKMGSKITGLELKLDDFERSNEVAEEISNKLGSYPYRALTWYDTNRTLFSWMKIEKWAAFVILSLIIMVASFNIASTLIMIVMEKTKEIGILKSMGAKSKSIMRIFIYQGLIVGVGGTVVGCIVGYLLCWSQYTYHWFALPSNVYIINFLPVLMKWTDFLFVALAAVAISYAATLYPSWKASQLDPVQAIRYE